MEQAQQLTLANNSLLNATKAEVKAFALQVMDMLEDGQQSPLEFHIQLKRMESILKQLTDKKENAAIADRYAKLLLSEAEKHGKKFDMYNGSFQIKETGTIYDWATTQDPTIAELLTQQEELKEKVKQRQEFLKAIPPQGMEVLFGEELITLYPPAKSSTTSLSVTLK